MKKYKKIIITYCICCNELSNQIVEGRYECIKCAQKIQNNICHLCFKKIYKLSTDNFIICPNCLLVENK